MPAYARNIMVRQPGLHPAYGAPNAFRHGRVHPQMREAERRDIHKDEMKMFLSERKKYGDDCVTYWDRKAAGTGLSRLYAENRQRARNSSMLLSNQERYLASLRENQVKDDFKITPEHVLRIVRIGTANSNRGDFATEWPLVVPDDAIYFVDRVIGRNVSAQSRLKSANDVGRRLYEVVAPNYATEITTISYTAPASGATHTGTGGTAMTPTPVIAGRIDVIVDGIAVGSDDGAGHFVGLVIDSDPAQNEVDYTTGAFKLRFLTAVDLPDDLPAGMGEVTTGATVTLEFHFDSENSANYGQFGDIEIAVTRKRFNARPMPLGYEYSMLMEAQLGLTGVGNAKDMLVQAIGDEHAIRRDYKAIQVMKRYALRNGLDTFNANFADEGEDNDFNHAQRFITKVAIMSGQVYKSQKRGMLNTAIAGPTALAYLSKMIKWEEDVTQDRVAGTFLAGTIGKMKVYGSVSDPDVGLLDDDEVLFTYKNLQEEGECAVAFGVLMELTASLTFPELYTRGTLATIEDFLVINSNFLRILKINNIVA